MIRKALSILTVGGVLLASIGISCAGSAHGQDEAARSAKNDSLVMARMTTNPMAALATLDSLYTAQSMSPQKLYYFRALIYHQMGDKRKTTEWCQKALVGNDLKQEDPVYFYKASDILSMTLTYVDEHEAALAAAQRGYEESKEDKTASGMHWTAILLHDMGYCEMLRGNVEEAEKCFSMAYIALKQIAASNNTYYNLMMCARVAYNIVDAYSTTDQYDKAELWLESATEAVDLMIASPECPKDMKDSYLGGLAVQKAIILVSTGRPVEAEKAYQEVLKLDYANTDVGVLERAIYLEKAQRWSNLQTLLPRIDSLYEAWGQPASLEHWKQYQN